MPDLTLPERLKALEKKATPGPWTHELGYGHAQDRIVGTDAMHVRGRMDGSRSYTERVCENFGDAELPGPAANIALICEIRNALPELLAALEDQARYRWLRDPARGVYWDGKILPDDPYVINGEWLHGESLDKAIDAARPTACATKGDGNEA